MEIAGFSGIISVQIAAELCKSCAIFLLVKQPENNRSYAHSPWRISGSATPVAVMPSMSNLPEPIIQST
jgi:hypothetical protein